LILEALMARFTLKFTTPKIAKEMADFVKFVRRYIRLRGYRWFAQFEGGKDVFVDLLYRQRGKYARPFLHFGTIGLVFLVVTFGPLILNRTEEDQQSQSASGILTVNAFGNSFNTLQSEEVKQYRGGEVITYVVQEGDTLSSIADKYGLQVSTILWENNITESTKLKPGQELRILPVDGIRHKVSRGETIFTVAKKYGLEDEAEAQKIVNYPFNEFLNDETFELATGQFILVPDGVKPNVPAPARTTRATGRQTPDAGSVTATGNFVWPASGKITQSFVFYHKALDIANRAAGPILAADAGVVVTSGWSSSGYGNHVVVDHGNGYTTLYAHLSVLQVRAGQRVNRGDVLGQMGSTGRSTGTHLHFEIRQGGSLINPLNFLR
jgi:murein DD-endopeptidase MepM/ murein hydrolase activator NlpD